MSWDIVIFSTKQKLEDLSEVDESQFVPIDFEAIFVSHFPNILDIGSGAKEIKGEDFSIVYYDGDGEPTSINTVNMYGEKGLYELVILARKYNWQIYDTGNGEMLDLENPARNGYENFQEYLKHVLKRSRNERN